MTFRITILTICVIISVYLCVAQQTKHGKDQTVCKDYSTPTGLVNRPRPNVTNDFHTHVECVIINKNKTTDIHEYFDATNNRGFIEQIDKGTRFDALYSYNTDEFITFFPDQLTQTPNCQVTPLSQTDQRFLLGYQNINNQPHIFSANDALHLSGQGVSEYYQGTTTIRGVAVDWWRSCQYWLNMDATMTVDWYFSSKSTWDSSVGVQIPIMAHVTGRIYMPDGTNHPFEHYYNFFHFRPYHDEVQSRHYETPAGLQCPGRIAVKKLPKVPDDAFSFTTEVLDVDNQGLSFVKVWDSCKENSKSKISKVSDHAFSFTTEVLDVDNKMLSFVKETFYYADKLVKYEYRGSPLYGDGDFIEIHDFHSGVSYTTDKLRGNCTAGKIETNDFDVKSAGPKTVRIRNSKEFFYFDTKGVTYEGIKQNRKIDCDTWIGKRNDWPFNSPANSTWEWYFASTTDPTTWTEIAPGPEPGAIPIQMRITVPSLGMNYQYNFYNFKKDKPDLLNFDISGCYQFRQRRKFQFQLPGTYIKVISQNQEKFKTFILDAVVKNVNVSPIRVSHIQVFFTDSVIVTFELLDVSPTMGDIQRSADYYETPLDFAANTLSQMIQNGQFVIQVSGAPFEQVPNIVVLPKSVVVTQYENKTSTLPDTVKAGYGAGPMAAVGVSMPIVGVGLGAVFAYFFFR